MSNQISLESQKIQDQQKQFVAEIEGLLQDLKKAFPQADLGDLKIKKGSRVIHGQTTRGNRENLQPEDLKELSQLINSKASGQVHSGKEASYQIQAGDEVLLRQERNGEISINKFAKAEISLNQDRTQETQTSPAQKPLTTTAVLETEADLDGDGLNKHSNSHFDCVI